MSNTGLFPLKFHRSPLVHLRNLNSRGSIIPVLAVANQVDQQEILAWPRVVFVPTKRQMLPVLDHFSTLPRLPTSFCYELRPNVCCIILSLSRARADESRRNATANIFQREKEGGVRIRRINCQTENNFSVLPAGLKITRTNPAPLRAARAIVAKRFRENPRRSFHFHVVHSRCEASIKFSIIENGWQRARLTPRRVLSALEFGCIATEAVASPLVSSCAPKRRHTGLGVVKSRLITRSTKMI